MAPDELNIHNNQPKTRAHDKGSKREEVRPVGCDGEVWFNRVGTIKLGGGGKKLK